MQLQGSDIVSARACGSCRQAVLLTAPVDDGKRSARRTGALGFDFMDELETPETPTARRCGQCGAASEGYAPLGGSA